MRHSRNALLLAAFASEAYINEFLEAKMSAGDFARVDRLSTPEKYVIGPRRALGKEVMQRDRNPLQSLRDLFVLRNALAHPRAAPDLELDGSPDRPHPVLNPLVAMRHTVQVAKAANLLITEGGRRTRDRYAGTVEAGERDLMRYSRRATAELPPMDDDLEERDAVFVAATRVAEVVLPQFPGYYRPAKRRRSA